MYMSISSNGGGGGEWVRTRDARHMRDAAAIWRSRVEATQLNVHASHERRRPRRVRASIGRRTRGKLLFAGIPEIGPNNFAPLLYQDV